MIEIYDTKIFIDFIDSEVKVIFGNIRDNEIETEIYIDDKYIKLNYIGKLKLSNREVHMNKSKDVIYIEDDYYYKETFKLNDINSNLNLIKENDIEIACQRGGFLLLLTINDIYPYFKNVIDEENPDVYEIDRHIRNLFKNFEYVILISIEEFDYGHIPFSNIYVEFANKYFNTEKGLNVLVDILYEESLNKKELKLTRIKKTNINKLKEYINRRKDYIKTEEIIKHLKVNEKWIQRYMKDMNIVYNNIGYNKKKRVWYKVK